MSKVYCSNCNLVFAEEDVKKYHDLNNFTDHKYIKENNVMEALDLFSKRVQKLDELLQKQKEENEKVEEVLVQKIQENRTAMIMFRSENKLTTLKPNFELLNCKKVEYSINNKSSYCEIYRIKNIVYMKLEFNGKIEGGAMNGVAEIKIDMPMWVIYSGSFNIESLNNCINGGKEIKNLYANYKQEGNKLYICIRKDGLNNVQTYWIKEKNNSSSSSFVINGNFLIEPPSFIRERKYYLYNFSEGKVICEKDNKLYLTDNWESGALIEECVENDKKAILKINGKYLNENNGFMTLGQKGGSLFDINIFPGYSDIGFFYFFENNQLKYFLEGNKEGVGLRKDFNDNCLFVLIKKKKKPEKNK